jgi:transposase-like protein
MVNIFIAGPSRRICCGDHIHHSSGEHRQANHESFRKEAQMKGHGSKYGRRKEDAIAALLSQRSIEEAARSIGTSQKTLLRWMKLADFKVAYNDARGHMMGQSNARLQQATSPAVTTLLKLMVSPDAPASARVRAAQCVVELAHKGYEQDNLELRISQLESMMADKTRPGNENCH